MPESDPGLCIGHRTRHKTIKMTQSSLKELTDLVLVTNIRQATLIYCHDLASVQ